MNNPAIGDEFCVYFFSEENDNRQCYCSGQCKWHDAVITDIDKLGVHYVIIETAESHSVKYRRRRTTIKVFIAGGTPNTTIYAASKNTAFYGLLKTMIKEIKETKAASI